MRSEVARLLPPDAVTIASLDLEALRDLPIAQSLSFGKSGDFEQFLAAAGFDPRQDADRVTIATDTVLGSNGKASLLIVEGRFGAGLRGLLQPAGEHAGVPLFATGPPSQRQTFGFLDEGTLAIGPAGQVKAAIDRWQAPDRESPVARLAMSHDGVHAWASTLDPRSLLAPHLDKVPGSGGPLSAIVDSMQSLSIRGVALSEAFRVELAFLCGDRTDAQSVADAATTLAAFGALAARESRPEIADLLGALQVERNESEALVSIELTERQIFELRNGGLGAVGAGLR